MSTHNAQKIGVATATIVGMNAMIGSGIFSAPEAIALSVGPAGILTYLFVVVAVWFMALSFARLAALFPQEGSFYTYAYQWGGRTAGLIAGGSYFIGLVVAMGLLSKMAGYYAASFFPASNAYLLGKIILALLVILNMFGVALSEVGQHILILCTTFPIVATIVACLWNGSIENFIPFAPFGYGNIMQATRIAIFGFFGFESAASLFNVVQNPDKNVARAVTYSIVIVGILYTLFIGSLIFAIPLTFFATGMQLPDILSNIFYQSPWFIFSIRISILSAILGTIHSMIWGSASLFRFLIQKISPSYSLTPATSVGSVGLLIFIAFNTLNDLSIFFNITALCIICALLMAMITLLTIPSEWKSGKNIKTVIGVITALIIFYFAAEGLVQALTKL